MKILKLILENFEAIKHCMHTNRIEIDFSKQENKICLLIGPNGSGKTTILSLLNPFATLGNLDVRDGYHLIIPHKNGLKEIWIENGPNLYKIQHIYTASKDTHSTKTFIQKNELELNPNGNVTSGKEIIKEELWVELDYMKLIRLGPNVKSLISQSSTERKQFMGKLLDDIGIFLQYYKHVNNNMRTLKEILAHTMDKLKRCKFDTKESYKKELKRMEKQIQSMESTLRSYQDEYVVLESKREELGDILEIRHNLDTYGKQLKKMEKTRSKLGEHPEPASYYRDAYEKAVVELNSKENLLTTNQMLLEKELVMRNSFEERLRRLAIQKNNVDETDKELDRLGKLLEDCKKSIKELKKNVESFDCDLTVEKFEEFFVFLKASESSLRKLYEFGQIPIKKIVSLLREKKNVVKYISSGMMEVTQSDQDEILLERLSKITGSNPKETGCEGCVALKMRQYIQMLLNDREAEETNSMEFYHDMELVYQGLLPILEGFKPFASTIDQFPDSIKNLFTIDAIFTRLEKGDTLYPIKVMDNFYTLLKEKENLELQEDRKQELIDEIRKIQRISGQDSILEEYALATKDLNKSLAQIREYRETIHSLEREVQELRLTAESMEDAANTCEFYEETKEKVITLQEAYQSYHNLSCSMNEREKLISSTKMELERARKEYGTLTTDYSNYKELTENLRSYQIHYDNMDLMKRALSSSKGGIPTIIIKHYLKDVVNITNDLLDIAYHGNVELERFNITADEFTIPVYINGTSLPDVKLASQGETALVGVALAFALVAQSLHGYNIMALDEMDGPLDTNNRRKFIEILEEMIERIGAEQIFLITHNDMFSYYPIDIIDLSEAYDKNAYRLANFIPIKKD